MVAKSMCDCVASILKKLNKYQNWTNLQTNNATTNF